MSNDFQFVTHWRIQGTVQEIREILADAPALARWWPSVYLQVRETKPGNGIGSAADIGKEVSLYTKGWLPYTLRWQFRVTEVSQAGFALEAWGDLTGMGRWHFAQEGEWVAIRYDWLVRADKPLLRLLAPLFKPLLAANHHWAMQMGEQSLRLELARRRAGKAAGQVPPPGPTFAAFVRKNVLG
jgi:hypothetical protein